MTLDCMSACDLGSGAEDHHGTRPPNSEVRWKADGREELNGRSPEVPAQPFHTSDKAKAQRGAVTGSRPHHYPEPGLELRVTLSPGTSLTALLGGGGGAHALFPFLLG